ncbi:HAD family hydrolase [Spirochaeta cellobiosiphila]|uniref:HAD family hydrolase n=1 Tax=Spirochaeta cellobiosiphila TaxID=504483 RepID=UPI000409880B|nr:HAD family hydrolase [Spirochaeta cellobiosiphila]
MSNIDNTLYTKIFEESISPLKPIGTYYNNTINLKFKPKVVLFDIYGTLLISRAGEVGTTIKSKTSIMNEVLNRYGLPIKNIDYTHTFRHLIEENHKERINEGILHPEVDILDIWKQFLNSTFERNFPRDILKQIAMTYECLNNPVYLMPDADKTISILKDNNIRLGIVSNAQFYTKPILEYLFQKKIDEIGFDNNLVTWSYIKKISKPSLCIFQDIIEQLANTGIHSSDVCYIGNDILNDIYTAQNLGFKGILFAGDKRSLRLRKKDPRCKHIIPDGIISDLNYLSKWINE